MSEGYVKFWGTRGSNPTPDNNKIKYGGDTSCVEVRTYENDAIILDMGTGAGLPGIILSIVGCSNVSLIDSSLKKITFEILES